MIGWAGDGPFEYPVAAHHQTDARRGLVVPRGPVTRRCPGRRRWLRIEADLYPEEVLVTALAIRLRRAVKWTATRSEDFAATNHGRDHIQDVELSATADGVITGVKATVYANLGAYLSGMAAGIPTVNCAFMVTGVYRIPNIRVDTLGVVTNTSRVDTYRGAGRPEATYLIERMVDQARAGAGHRPGGDPPAQLRSRGRVSLPGAHRLRPGQW